MGLKPLEFVDCLSDSPYFRENLHVYEKELERTSKAIKGLVAECKGLLLAAQNLSEAQKKFSDTLQKFEFNCIDGEQTEDEIVIAGSLKQFGKLISTIEEARGRMLACAQDRIITPLEIFRKEHIGGAREERKKFDKLTAKFYQSQERNLNLKTKNSNTDAVKEDDNELVLKRGAFYRASMQYVLLLQEVQERKKFEFVETLLGFMYSWLTFYHEGHEVHNEFKPFTTELQVRLQKCRENFKTAHEQAEQLMNRMLEVRGTKPQSDTTGARRSSTKEGYLYLMEKKTLGTTSWNKHYCEYFKTGKKLKLMQYNPVKPGPIETLDMNLLSCTRRASDSIEKRFCFDITVSERPEPLTFQAVSQEDMQLWLDAMDGKEPIYEQPSSSADSDSSLLDDIGFNFIHKCIHAIERRGLDDQGIYRVVGVNSKVNKLLNLGLNRKKCDKLNLDDPGGEWEVKTVTSALKNYFRSLPQPLMTFDMHFDFIQAAKLEPARRVDGIHYLVHQLPDANFHMLDILCAHLNKVSKNSSKNLMGVANLGVCFGPTLMRPQEETIAAIMDIKFCNIVVEILIENHEQIFTTQPDGAAAPETKALSNAQPPPSHAKGPAPPVPPAVGKPNINSLPLNNQNQNVVSASRKESPFLSGGGGAGGGGVMISSTTSAPGGSSSPVYANTANNNHQTYAQVRAKLRPTAGFYSQYSGDQPSSTSSSSESLNSNKYAGATNATTQSSQSLNESTPPVASPAAAAAQRPSQTYSTYSPTPVVSGRPPGGGSSSSAAGQQPTGFGSPYDQNRMDKNDPAGVAAAMLYGGGYKKRPSADSITFSISSSTSSVSSISSATGFAAGAAHTSRRKVRTLYACDAENESELSFEPNQIISNVKPSREPGWLEGSLDGKTGLIPANYVEYLNLN